MKYIVGRIVVTKSYEEWAQAIEDQIRFKREEFPNSSLTASHQERAVFYQDHSRCPKEVAEILLSSICMLVAEDPVNQHSEPLDLYRKKYRDLEKLVDKICKHDLVHNWSAAGSIELFSPQDFRCQHGKTIRFKKKCLMIRAKLERFRSLQDLLKKFSKTRNTHLIRRTQDELRTWLCKANVDVQTADLNDYCREDTLSSEDEKYRQKFGDSIEKPKPGRQIKQFQNKVIRRLMPLLLKCYANSSAASDALGTVFLSFFGLKVDGESLDRQWRRLKPTKRKPKQIS